MYLKHKTFECQTWQCPLINMINGVGVISDYIRLSSRGTFLNCPTGRGTGSPTMSPGSPWCKQLLQGPQCHQEMRWQSHRIKCNSDLALHLMAPPPSEKPQDLESRLQYLLLPSPTPRLCLSWPWISEKARHWAFLDKCSQSVMPG